MIDMHLILPRLTLPSLRMHCTCFKKELVWIALRAHNTFLYSGKTKLLAGILEWKLSRIYKACCERELWKIVKNIWGCLWLVEDQKLTPSRIFGKKLQKKY